VVRNQGKVTRFVVMAMLQAARAESLGLPRDSAYSWGLNRAIFYAAAKSGFRGGSAKASRFGTKGNYDAAWEEARRVVDEFDRAVLEARERFYEEVYKPRRDALSDEWTRKYSPPSRSK
jgi:hypothetical protein